MSTITGDLNIIVSSQGDYTEVTTANLDMSGYAEDSVFVIATLPTKGDLYLGSTLLELDDEFTRAQYILDKLTYRHNGEDIVADSFGVITRDDPSGTPIDSSEATVSITISVSNFGWALQVIPTNSPPEIVAYLSSRFSLDQALIWNNSHWGEAKVVQVVDASVSTFLQTLLTKDNDDRLSFFLDSENDYVNGVYSNSIADRLYSELQKDSYASLMDLVKTHGSLLLTSATVKDGVSATALDDFDTILANRSIDTNKSIRVPNSDLYGAMDIVKARLNS